MNEDTHDHEILKQYIGKLLEIKDKPALKEQDLKDVAKELGMSEKYLARVDKRAGEHVKRGQGFLEADCHDDAIEEFENALALKPLNYEVLINTARAYQARYLEKHSREDRKKAYRLALKCISLKPDMETGYRIIRELKKGRQGTAAGKRTLLILLFVLSGIAVIMSIVYILGTGGGRGGADAAESRAVPGAGDTKQGVPAETEIPVEFISSDKSEGIELAVRKSQLYRSTDYASYTLQADVTTKRYEIYSMKLKVSWLDSSGGLLRTDYINAVNRYDPYFRPGTVLPVQSIKSDPELVPLVKNTEVSVYLIEKGEAPARYPRFKEIPVTWEYGKSSSFDISAFERGSRISGSSKRLYHSLELEVKNCGLRQIKLLKLKADWFDHENNVLESVQRYLVTSSGPWFRPGQIRTVRISTNLPEGVKDFSRYGISVIEIE